MIDPKAYGARRPRFSGILTVMLCVLIAGDVIVANAQGMPPHAQDDWDFVSYNELAIIDILSNDSGIEAPLAPYSVTIVTQPQFGTVTADPLTGVVAYVPDGNAAGGDWFEYTVEDMVGNLSNSARVDVDLMNMPPSIDSFSAISESGNAWTFSGHVTDENPAGVSITLSGIIDVQNVPVEADGSFSTTVVLDPNAMGEVTAEALDELGLQSSQEYVAAGSPPPVANDDWDLTSYNEFVIIDILSNDNASAEPLAPYGVTIVTQPQYGTVAVDPLTGLVVYVPDGNADGIDSFEYTVDDMAGNFSNVARVDIDLMNMPPTIDEFDALPGTGNTWTFTGRITDENPSAMTVTLGGIVDVQNVPVETDGSFSVTIALAPEAFGSVSANATDQLGAQSGTSYITAGQYP